MDFIEGWGLYVEGLGQRIGLYDDPLSLFGHYFVGKEIFGQFVASQDNP